MTDELTPSDPTPPTHRTPNRPHVVLAAGSTATARIDGISAAGAAPELLAHTPSADAELLAYGDVVAAPTVPASPTGCPTPALASRAAREVLGLDATVVDAGLVAQTGAPTVEVGAAPGADLREPVAVPDAAEIAARARDWARSLPVERVAIAETIPGGTTTALGLLRALGERATVSSSLPENPVSQKRSIVEDGLAASGVDPGGFAGEPLAAIRAVGDPVQATALGLLEGAVTAGVDVELWGGTQLLAVVAAARHAQIGIDGERSGASAGAGELVRVATTSYVADDDSAAVRELAADLDVRLSATDPAFDECDHAGLQRFAAGEAKEGVGMGGALGLAAERDALPAVRERFRTLYADLVGDPAEVAAGGAGGAGDGGVTDADGGDRDAPDTGGRAGGGAREP